MKTLLLFFILASPLLAQEGLKSGKLKHTADSYFVEEDYFKAIPYYEELTKRYPKKVAYQYNLAICYSNSPAHQEDALILFQQIQKTKSGYKDVDYYLGLSYLSLSRFDSALIQFITLQEKTKDAVRKEELRRLIENCKNGQEFIAKPLDVDIINLGSAINTKDKEYAPVISTDESILIFTYRGEKSMGGLQDPYFNPVKQNGDYYEDIYHSYNINGEWKATEPITSLNTLGHDASIALSPDGQTLFTYKTDLGKKESNGQIYISHLKGSSWTTPEPLNKNINSEYWEGSVTMTSDGLTLYFASKRPGGLGGKDLYVSHKAPDGDWGPALNMGQVINTKYDDDAPFIHPNGKVLYFSSKGHNSMGKYDIFTSVQDPKGAWQTPINIGYPVNTTADDIYYIVSADGKHAYFSSSRKGGYGLDDIYVITPGMFHVSEPIGMVLLKGTISVNDTLRGGQLSVFAQGDSTLLSEHTANEETGKFLVALQSGQAYTVRFNIDGFPEHNEFIEASNIEDFIELNTPVSIYTEEYLKAKELKIDTNEVEKIITVELKDKGSGKLSYQDIINEYGDSIYDHLIFTVQVAAYKNPESFNYHWLDELGKVKQKLEPDGITRFQIGEFVNLADTEILKKKVIEKGVKDAFIVGLYNGKRYTINQCYEKNFFR